MTIPSASRRTWAVAVVAALAMVGLTVAVGSGWAPLARLDVWLSDHAFASTYGHRGRVRAWSAVTDWGGPEPVRWLLVAAGVVALVRRRVATGVWLVVLSALEGVVAPLSKDLLDRPRPTWPDPITVLASSSYPSGHATAAATAAVALALVVRRTAVTWCAVVVALAVAASRVLLGAHYPSDVLGGLLLGTLLATTTYGLVSVVAARRAPQPVSRAS